jgi:dTDP-4-dehydrorhamnose reductase
MRIAVIGARGQLGAAVVHECSAAHEVVPFTHADLDITNGAAVHAALADASPGVVINCAAYNAVDAAEKHPVEAMQVNSLAVRSMARWATANDAALVHYSTDFVFDGTASRPYTEQDPTSPRSAYGASKLMGEWFALDAPRPYVLRVESLFGRAPDGPPAKGSVESIVAALQAGGSPKVFADRTVSPTSVRDAARATRLLIEGSLPTGLYHCVNTGSCTWQELAEYVARLLAIVPRLEVVKFADVVLPAARPQYCALSNDRLRSVGIEMPTWQDALRRYITDHHQGEASSRDRASPEVMQK